MQELSIFLIGISAGLILAWGIEFVFNQKQGLSYTHDDLLRGGKMNIRKFICRLNKYFQLPAWLNRLLDCQRYIPKPKPPEPPKPIKIRIKVCALSGLLPRQYCKNIVEEEFEIGDEPRKTCITCITPRKMPYERIVFVPDLMTATGDIDAFFQKISDAGATGIRIFLVYGWPDNSCSPWKQIGIWNAGYSDAPMLPFYDMNYFDEKYFERLEKILSLIKHYELSVILTLDDFCSLKQSGWQKYRHPVLSSAPDRDMNDPSINRLPGGYYAEGPETIQLYLHRFYEHLLKIAQYMKVDFLVERMNEYDALDYPDDFYIEWHRKEIEFLEKCWRSIIYTIASLGRGYIKPQIHSILYTIASPGRGYIKEFAQQVHLISPHQIISPEQFPKDWRLTPERTLPSGDGGWGGTGHPDQKGRAGMGIEEAKRMKAFLKERDFWGYEYMDRGLWFRNNDKAHLDDFNPEPLKILSWED